MEAVKIEQNIEKEILVLKNENKFLKEKMEHNFLHYDYQELLKRIQSNNAKIEVLQSILD